MNFLNSQERIRLVMVGSNDPDENRLNNVIHSVGNIESLGVMDSQELDLSSIDTTLPFVILADIGDSDLRRFQSMMNIARRFPCAVLAIIPNMDRPLILSMLRMGVRGFVTQQADGDEILKAIEGVGAGAVWVSRELLYEAFSREVRRAPSQPRDQAINGRDILSQLTPREQDILFCLREGLSDKEIARELNISHKTVKTHLQHIFKKTKIHSRLQLAVRGVSPSFTNMP